MEVEGRHTEEQPINPDNSSKDWPFSYFKFDKERDSPDQVRNTILVVAALVAAASYQAVMSPPNDFKNLTRYTQLIFIYANTLAWSSSITIIAMLTTSSGSKSNPIGLFFSGKPRLSSSSILCLLRWR
ncbi:hypothetical protein E3N88_14171 [Mikania micrantha]|uniref:PGG domain-containing protein n=1 Tax=Mikania micrantha TaxID=192012 RepID=A0A5N6P2D8_9ASTR|nr:hypothetical protein E3N88_14171 [Mikania micrantha]